MAAPVEKALVSFFAGFRSRSRRFAVIALLGGLLLAQTLLVVHRIDHNRSEHGATCMLCVAADHSPGAVSQTVLAIAPSPPESVASNVFAAAAAPTRFFYHSRAPPQHLRA